MAARAQSEVFVKTFLVDVTATVDSGSAGLAKEVNDYILTLDDTLDIHTTMTSAGYGNKVIFTVVAEK